MHLAAVLAERIAAAARPGDPLVVGLTGPQGSGKSTLAAQLLAGRTAVLSLDDFYLPKADRQRLARDVHPLLATRGVPGTHDVSLGLETLASLGRPGVTRMPSFDKASDDRRSPSDWLAFEGPADVVIFEGWCVGARPQSAAELVRPVNDLERERDADGVWRSYANDALAGDYQRLFGLINLQLLLLAPSFDVVLGWRLQQEHELRARTGRGQSDTEIAVFIQHYERLTRHIAAEMPGRADVVVWLGVGREVLELRGQSDLPSNPLIPTKPG